MEKIEKQKISPTIAEAMLKLNIDNNRPISISVVNQYTIDMIAQKWIATADTIKFDVQGRLIDGQHRLHAIVKSGMTVDIWVATEIEETAVRYIDTGRKRSANDLLHMQGIAGGYAMEVSSVSRKIINWERDATAVLSNFGNGGGIKLRGSISNSQILEYCEKNPAVVDFAIFGKALYSKTPVKLFSAADLGFLYWLLSQKDPIAAKDFLEKLCLKDNVPADSPIACLYNRLLSSKTSLTPVLKLKLTFQAWNLWRQNKKISALKVAHLEEMPVLI